MPRPNDALPPRPAPASRASSRSAKSGAGVWSQRWQEAARSVGLNASDPIVLALSGGADSMLLLHWLSQSAARPPILAAHIQHGVRGSESAEDEQFCRDVCRGLGVPFTVRKVALSPEGPSFEARARQARYRALSSVALEASCEVILTGHHCDDALETLLMRWMRGSDLPGLNGIPTETLWRHNDDLSAADQALPDLVGAAGHLADAAKQSQIERPEDWLPRSVRVVRPLLSLRREEVRCLLRENGFGWREDSSNNDPAHTRNRVRTQLLPWLEANAGEAALENLLRFAASVEALEADCARQTAHLQWDELPFSLAPASEEPSGPDSNSASNSTAGGALARSELTKLIKPLRRRVLWRLLTQGTGRGPGRTLLESILRDLERGRCTRHSLPGEWSLVLRSAQLLLLPPLKDDQRDSHGTRIAGSGFRSVGDDLEGQAHLPFPAPEPATAQANNTNTATSSAQENSDEGGSLSLPGALQLPDGRRLSAELVQSPSDDPVPQDPQQVELDAEGLTGSLYVRWSQPGDRFHPLGAPGSKPLRRFLADAGIPREQRSRVPLVFAGNELLWAAGVRPCESRRVRSTTRLRLRLKLSS